MKDIYVVEYSPYSAKVGMSPWHVDRLERSIKKNRHSMSPGYENVWMPVFIGTFVECNEEIEILRKEAEHIKI